MTNTFRCYLVGEDKHAAMTELPVADLPAGDVLIRAHYSSLNYKDALAATGHPGVARKLPHVPGVDVSGVVEASDCDEYQVGDEVLVTGYELGAPRWGGWSELVRVPSEWIVRLPKTLTLRDVMVLGTAGFTAAQCVASLERMDITPERGEVLVTGASGGVGSMAVGILARLGYDVVAMTGKESAHEQLLSWGASRIVGRDAVDTTSDKPMLKGEWSAAIDTVGGSLLAALTKTIQHRGCIATCGNVGGTDLPLTVFPFILRGINLDGIDSAMCPRRERLAIWEALNTVWRLPLDSYANEVSLENVSESVQQILRGEIMGRTVVRIQ